MAYKAPLYGRQTSQMKILPFDFADTCRYFKHFSGEDKALVYGNVGGTPQYLLQMDDRASIEDNIKNTFLNPTSSLFEEPENLLKQEVRELGRWWGTDPSTRSQTEIDIMGEQDKNTALFGGCKWTNEKVDVGVLDILVKRSRIFHYREIPFYLFAKKGSQKGVWRLSASWEMLHWRI